MAAITVEPLNKGHVGTRSFVLYREVSFIRRFVLYREVSFIRSVLYQRFHYILLPQLPRETGVSTENRLETV